MRAPHTPLPRRPEWRRIAEFAAVTAALLAVLAACLATLQTDVSGSHSDYTLDTGEFQLALNLAGTLHPTGYPLYALTGAVFAAAARALGATPAAAASLFSLVWGLGTLALLAAILRVLGGRWLHGAVAALALAATHSFWVHSVIAEVYSLSIFFTALCMWLALRCARAPGALPWLGLALGLAVGHHRSAALMLPAIGLFLILRGAWRGLRWQTALLTVAAFLGSFLVYLYLPWRAAQGAAWIYGQPGAWPGLADLFTAREYRDLMQPELDPARWLENAAPVIQAMASALSPALLGLGWLGVAVAFARRATRGAAALLALTGLASVAFAIVFPRAVFLPAVLLPAMLVSAAGIGLLLAALAAWRAWIGLAATAGIAALTIGLAVQNGPAVAEYSRNRIGRALLDSVAALNEPQPVLAAPWGTDYFALAYGQLLTGEIAGARLVSPADDLAPFLAEGGALYAPRDQFYTYPPAFWQQRYGPVCLSSAGWRLVSVRRAPCAGDPPAAGEPLAWFGDRIALQGLSIDRRPATRELIATLVWHAAGAPAADYSVAVFLADQPALSGPQDIVAQEDSGHPVYGLRPTTGWEPGEIVREDYLLAWPEGRSPSHLLVRLYRRDPDSGGFETLGEHTAPLPAFSN